MVFPDITLTIRYDSILFLIFGISVFTKMFETSLFINHHLD